MRPYSVVHDTSPCRQYRRGQYRGWWAEGQATRLARQGLGRSGALPCALPGCGKVGRQAQAHATAGKLCGRPPPSRSLPAAASACSGSAGGQAGAAQPEWGAGQPGRAAGRPASHSSHSNTDSRGRVNGCLLPATAASDPAHLDCLVDVDACRVVEPLVKGGQRGGQGAEHLAALGQHCGEAMREGQAVCLAR